MPRSKSPPKVRPCYCSWGDECQTFQKEIKRLAPPGHPWIGKNVIIQMSPSRVDGLLSLHNAAFLAGIEKHFKPRIGTDSDESKGVELHIARHHFPRGLFAWKKETGIKRFSHILSRDDIRSIETVDHGRCRMGEYTNSVAFLCKERLAGTFVQKQGSRTYDYRNSYPQTPLETRGAVLSFINNLLNRTDVNGVVRPPISIVTESKKVAEESAAKDNVTRDEDPPLVSQNHVTSSPMRPAVAPLTTLPPPILPKPVDISMLYSPLYACHAKMGELYQNFIAAHSYDMEVHDLMARARGSKRTEEAWDELSRRFHSYHEVSVKKIFTLITGCHENSMGFLIGERVSFIPCVGFGSLTVGGTATRNMEEQCELFTFRALTWDGRDVSCGNCRRLKVNSESKEIRSKQRRENGVPVTQNPKLVDMDERQLRMHCLEQIRQNRNLKRRVNRYVSRLNADKKKLVVPRGSSLHEILQEACAFVEKNIGSSKEDLLKAFIDIHMDDDEQDEISDVAEKSECVNTIVANILNMGASLRGKTMKCRYPPHLINTALCLFLRNRKAYDELRTSGVICLPSPRTLRRIGTKFKSREGGDPSIYRILQNEMKRLPAGQCMMGHLMVDAIKLKNGIAFNSNSNEIVGFVEDGFNLRSMYQEILVVPPTTTDTNTSMTLAGAGSDEEGNDCGERAKRKEVTVYANQWRFRSTRGVVHNGDYYFNDGSLDGDELLRQFLHVLTSYEMIGCRVYGLVSDAGGGNASMLKILRGGRKVEGPWANLESVSFTNPIDPQRKIFFWTCSTHGLKSLRNGLHKSQEGMVRDFVYDDVEFGWEQLEDCYERDECRILTPGCKRRADLVKHAVHLDKYTLMNCKYAKMPFSERTISEMLSEASSKLMMRLDIDSDVTFPSQWHKFQHFIKQLKEEVQRRADDTVSRAARSLICTLEYQVAMHGIFIERLLNSKWNLTLANLESERSVLAAAVGYFTSWRAQRTDLETRRNYTDRRESAKHYLADQTVENLILTVSGFVSYAECILSIDPLKEVAYVPGLHSNQSSIESFFSRIRQLGKDRPDLYGGGVTQQNVLNSYASISQKKKRKRGNVSYPSDTIAPETEPVAERIETDPRHAEAEMRLKGFMSAAKNRTIERSDTVLPSTFVHKGSAFGFLLAEVLSSMSVDFQGVCLEDRVFQDYFVLSAHTPYYEWFQAVIVDDNQERFTHMCQAMLGVIFHLAEECLEGKKTGPESSFEYRVTSFMQSNRLPELISQFEGQDGNSEDHRLCYVILLDFMKSKFFSLWLPEAIRVYRRNLQRPERSEELVVELRDDNVNRFAGWALHKALKKHTFADYDGSEANLILVTVTEENMNENRQEKEDSDGERELSQEHVSLTATEDERKKEVSQVLHDMKVLRSEILGDHDYIARYYPVDDAIRNKGALTLISPMYIGYLSTITKYITTTLTIQDVKTHARDGKIKDIFWDRMAKDGTLDVVDDIVKISESRIATKVLGGDDRRSLIMEMIKPMVNAQIGDVLKEYRNKELSRVNDAVSFRGQLSVISKRQDTSKPVGAILSDE